MQRRPGRRRPVQPSREQALFDFKVRESARARHVRLVMSMREGLVLVVPKGFDQGGIPAIIKKKESWIIEAAAERERRRRSSPVSASEELPGVVRLLALGEEWRVERSRGRGRGEGRVQAREGAGRVVRLFGDIDDEAACRRALSRWVGRKAREVLIPQIVKLAERWRLPLGEVSIRQQKTRWGSCSPSNAVSLNAKLLFLPPELVEYVLIHELCHLTQPDHSPRYWALVESIDPDFRRKRTALRDAVALVPGWITT